MINEFHEKNQNSYTVAFSIIKKIKFGQNICIMGSLSELGNWKLPLLNLKWNEGDVWKANLVLSSEVNFFEYKFVIVENSNLTWEKGHNRLFSLRNNEEEDHFQIKAVWEKFFIKFMIYYPVSDSDEEMHIMGGATSIGKWFKDGRKPLKMKLGKEKNLYDIKGRFWEFKADFDVNDPDNYEFEYRYSIFNNKTNSALWEREPNRKLILLNDPKVLSMTKEEYDKLFPVSNKDYELLTNNYIIRFDLNFVADLVFDKMGDYPIYIGPYPQNGKDIEVLKQIGITAVINVQSDLDLVHRQINWKENLKSYNENKIIIERYPIFDFNSEDLIKKLRGGINLLNNYLREKHVVYVHCTAGMSRAAAIVICYLYIFQFFSLDEAYEFVKKHRSIICPNLSAIEQFIKNEENKKIEIEIKKNEDKKKFEKEKKNETIEKKEEKVKNMKNLYEEKVKNTSHAISPKFEKKEKISKKDKTDKNKQIKEKNAINISQKISSNKDENDRIEDNKLETVEIVKNMTKVNNPEENVLINDNNDDITMKEITNPSKEAPKNIDSNECI